MSTKPDYTALDAAIIERIRGNLDPYGGEAHKLAQVMEDCSDADARRRKHAFRFIDARLQRMRKDGAIRHDRKAGWIIA